MSIDRFLKAQKIHTKKHLLKSKMARREATGYGSYSLRSRDWASVPYHKNMP